MGKGFLHFWGHHLYQIRQFVVSGNSIWLACSCCVIIDLTLKSRVKLTVLDFELLNTFTKFFLQMLLLKSQSSNGLSCLVFKHITIFLSVPLKCVN